MNPVHYLAIDTETGGLLPGQSALLSLSIVPSWDHAPLTLHFQPIGQLEDNACLVNGYTPELWKVRGAVPLKHGLIAVQQWLEASGSWEKKAHPLAHNAAFDAAFLNAAERLTGISLSLPRRWRCSMVTLLAAQDAGHIDQRAAASLDSLGSLSGYWATHPRAPYHDATQDARCCLHGYQWLISQLARKDADS